MPQYNNIIPSTEDRDQQANDLINRYELLRTKRQPFEDLWEEVTEVFLPSRSLFGDKDTERGQKTGENQFDGTARASFRDKSDGMQGYMISRQLRWFQLHLRDRKLEDLPGVKQWLEDCENGLYNTFAISNFYESAGEFLDDGGCTGTAVMFLEENTTENKLRYRVIHPKEFYVAENKFQIVDTVFRVYWMTFRNFVQRFGSTEEDYAFLKRWNPMLDEILNTNPDDMTEVLHAVYPNTDRKEGKIDKLNKPFKSVYVWKDHSAVVREGGFEEFPYLVWREKKNADEVYGRSACIDALVEAKKLNLITKTGMKVAQLQAEPPLNVPESLRGRVQLVPRGLNYYNDPREQVTPVPIGGNYAVNVDQMERWQKLLERHLRVDFFVLLSRAERAYTATEVIERQGEKSALLNPMLGRLSSEFLDPVIDLTFSKELRANRLPAPPESLLQELKSMGKQSADLEIMYTGQLAQAQKKFHVVQGVQQGLASIAPLMQFEPNLRFLFDWVQMAKELAESTNMPQKVIREDDDYQRLIAQEAERQQQMQQQQMALEAGKIMPGLNQEVQPNSILQNMNQALSQGGAV